MKLQYLLFTVLGRRGGGGGGGEFWEECLNKIIQLKHKTGKIRILYIIEYNRLVAF